MTLSKKMVVAFIAILSLIGLAFAVFENPKESSDRSGLRSLDLGNVETSTANTDKHLLKQIETLSQEVLTLRHNQAQMNETVNGLVKMLRKLEQWQNQASVDQGSSEIANTAYQPSDDEIAKTLIEHYEASLGSEPIDSNWSSEAYEKVESIIQEHSPDDSRIVSMDCGETLCKLDLAHTSKDAMDKFLSEFPFYLGWNSSSHIKTEDQGDGSMRAKIYISRDGHSLPRLN